MEPEASDADEADSEESGVGSPNQSWEKRRSPLTGNDDLADEVTDGPGDAAHPDRRTAAAAVRNKEEARRMWTSRPSDCDEKMGWLQTHSPIGDDLSDNLEGTSQKDPSERWWAGGRRKSWSRVYKETDYTRLQTRRIRRATAALSVSLVRKKAL